MCTFLKENKIKTTDKDIIVFKVVEYANKYKCISPLQRFKYMVDKEYNIGNIGIGKTRVLAMINYPYYTTIGFYSYSPDIYYFLKNNFLYIGERSPNVDIYCSDAVSLGMFIIPKGSRYVVEDNIYVSDKLIYTGKHINCSQKGFDLEKFASFRKKVQNLAGI